jgi:Tfp pilus assembly protein PilN
MIKVNLLKSVTDRRDGAVASVEKKVSSPFTKFALMGVAVMALTFALTGWDVVSAHMAKTSVESDLAKEKETEAQLQAIIKEQADLEQKIKAIDTRIAAIKNLRANQAGPSAVLESIRERISTTPGLYLESVEQKGESLVIKGNSPDEAAITTFGRSLEFSSGLFSNLSIETQRKETPVKQIVNGVETQAMELETVTFIIRCAYTPGKVAEKQNGTVAQNGAAPAQAGQPGAQPAQAAAQPAAGNPQPPQVAAKK